MPIPDAGHSEYLIFITLSLLLLAGCVGCTRTSGSSLTSNVKHEQAQAERKPLTLPVEKPRIVVRKADRKLEFYSDQTLLRAYQVGLGFNPEPDKKQEGDGATPEGDFYVFVKNNRSAYYLSLGVSYPNAEDAERGLRDGLITKAQYNSILEATKKKTAPPQHTKLGGLIYIHGNGASRDWTWGCVALENEDMKELFDAVVVGTPVTIFP
jgi:murein L,D-transpeptidase YafK